MFITEDLKSRVQAMVVHMERRIEFLVPLTHQEAGWAADSTLCWAVERALHVNIECMTDIANLVIDTLVMRDPANYQDMLCVLMEERVVSPAWYEVMATVFSVRSRLVREFFDLTPTDVEAAARTYAPLFAEYATNIRAYLGLSA